MLARMAARYDQQLSHAVRAWESQVAALASSGVPGSAPMSRDELAAFVAELEVQLTALRDEADAAALAGQEWKRRTAQARATGREDLARQAEAREREQVAIAAPLAIEAMRLSGVYETARKALAERDAKEAT